MEEINLMDILKYIKSKFIFLIITIVIGFILGLGYKLFIEEPKYKSTTTLILVGFKTETTNDAIDNNELMINQKLITTYQQIAKSKEVLSKVTKELKLKTSAEALASKVSVTGVDNTEIITISVTDKNAKKAYEITKKLSEVFIEKVKDIYNVSNVSILDKPKVATHSSNMKFSKIIFISMFLGLMTGVGILVIIYYFDTTIKTTEQIESKFDVPILGSVPKYEDKDKKKKTKKRGRRR